MAFSSPASRLERPLHLPEPRSEALRRTFHPRDRNPAQTGRGPTSVSLDADRDERQFRLETCDAEYEANGKISLFAEHSPNVSINATGGRQDEAAARLGIKIGTFRMAITRLRQRYAEILRDSVADTLTNRSKVEEELGHLLEVFQK